MLVQPARAASAPVPETGGGEVTPARITAQYIRDTKLVTSAYKCYDGSRYEVHTPAL